MKNKFRRQQTAGRSRDPSDTWRGRGLAAAAAAAAAAEWGGGADSVELELESINKSSSSTSSSSSTLERVLSWRPFPFFFLFFLFRFPGASSSTSRQVRGGGSSEAKKKMLKKKWKTKERRGRGPRASTSIHNARVQADVVRTSRSFRCHRVALYSTWFHFNSIATNGGRFHRIFPPDFDLDPPNLPGFTGFLNPRNSPDFVLLLLRLLLLMLSNCIEFYALLPSFT